MAHIVIDARRVRDFGIGTYIRSLVQALGAIDRTNQYTLVSGPGSTFNNFFKIHNDQLLIARPLHDLPSKFLSIRIRSTDPDGSFVLVLDVRRKRDGTDQTED